MRSSATVGRPRMVLKASHHRICLKTSHRRKTDETVVRESDRDSYIAPPKPRARR